MQMTRDDHLSSRSESGSKQKGREAARKRAFSPIEQGTTTPTTAKKKTRRARQTRFEALLFFRPFFWLSLALALFARWWWGLDRHAAVPPRSVLPMLLRHPRSLDNDLVTASSRRRARFAGRETVKSRARPVEDCLAKKNGDANSSMYFCAMRRKQMLVPLAPPRSRSHARPDQCSATPRRKPVNAQRHRNRKKLLTSEEALDLAPSAHTSMVFEEQRRFVAEASANCCSGLVCSIVCVLCSFEGFLAPC